MKLLSWNVNGLRAIYKKNFMDWFIEKNADIFCVQETKAHREQLPDDLIEREGYSSYFAQAEKKGYSGVALWTRKRPESTSYQLNIPRFDLEGRLIQADYSEFTLFNIY
ncbi:unnamed protein product, partial [marine sediment metagenome]